MNNARPNAIFPVPDSGYFFRVSRESVDQQRKFSHPCQDPNHVRGEGAWGKSLGPLQHGILVSKHHFVDTFRHKKSLVSKEGHQHLYDILVQF